MTSAADQWQHCFKELPLVAILRGIRPEEVLSVGQVLADAGFRIVEVPLNSPEPYESIRLLSEKFGSQLIVGAGTVLNVEHVKSTVASGGRLIVAPNFNATVAAAALESAAVYCPGVATPTEAFNALDSGASALKLFPAEMISPAIVKAMRAVLPDDINLLPVGGITPENISAFMQAGCTGFGIGSALYKPGKHLTEIKRSAIRFIAALENQ